MSAPSRLPAAPRAPSPAWWERSDLGYRRDTLHLGRHDLEDLGRTRGTPLFAYHASRIRANLRRLQAALSDTGKRTGVFYAMKSNRFPPLLRFLHGLGRCGVDVCSPEELLRARRCGFAEEAISYTGTSMSEADARCLARHPGVIVNCDSLSSMRRLARLAPGRRIGLRINPAVGLGYRQNPRLRYAGGTTTKFGIYWEQFFAALALAEASGLRVEGLHFHAGCGYLTPQLEALEAVLVAARPFIAAVPGLRYVNLGGGLGIPLVAGDAPLDLAAWSRVVARHFRRDRCEIWVEPGDYLVKDAGVLLLEVNTVERKRDTLFVGVNGGFNLHPEPAFYALPLLPLPCRRRAAPRRRVTIAGNINEALDLLAENVSFPDPVEGELLAFLNAGGYGAAMSSNHCMRGKFREILL